MMSQHPEPHIRRAARVLAMVGELHKLGYQRLRVMPFMSPSGCYWRFWIGPITFFYRNHGAFQNQMAGGFDDDELQERAAVACYTSGQTNQYFGWKDAQADNVRSLANKFIRRFQTVVESGRGWDYPYAGWYQRLLGLAEAGWFPVVLQDCVKVVYDHIPLSDVRPREWHGQVDTPNLPMPPPGGAATGLKGLRRTRNFGPRDRDAPQAAQAGSNFEALPNNGVASLQMNQPKLTTKDELRTAVKRQLNVSKNSLDFAWIDAIERLGR